MKVKITNRSIISGASILIILIASALVNAVAPVLADIAPTTNEPAQIGGITFADSMNDADRAYLQTSLGFLRNNLPEWHAYVAQTEQFILSVDQTEDADWVVAKSTCCDDLGSGTITFEDHFNLVAASGDSGDQTIQARQVAFLSTLVHEVTHLRDYRAGRIPPKMDAVACIASEGAAYTKEFEFKRALASASFNRGKTGEDYRSAAKRQLDAEESQFNRQFWKLYCILAHPNVMDD